MNPLTGISERYKRWRHSRGFGVHSPFAYELVKSVVSPGDYAYYGYHDIDRALLTPGADVGNNLRHDSRLLLRLLVFLRSKRLLIYPPKQSIMVCAAECAAVKCDAMTKTSLSKANDDTLILVTGNPPFHEEIIAAMGSRAAVMAMDYNRQFRELIVRSMTDGLVLEGTRILLAVPRPDMAFTSYSMKF